MKKTIVILTLFVVAFAAFKLIQYNQIKQAYIEPYLIVDQVIREAVENKSDTNHILSEEEWKIYKENSVYKNIRGAIEWSEFKEYVQCEGLSYSQGKASYSIMREKYKRKHALISVNCVEYSNNGLDATPVKEIALLLEKINGSWKLVGKSVDDK